MYRHLSLFLLLLSALPILAQRYTISGYITDAESGERLIGASVYDTISHQGVATNNAGFYTLTLPAGEHVLQVSYVGYHSSRVCAILLKSDTICHFAMRSSARLEEVEVVGRQSVSSPNSVQMSTIEVPVSQIKNIPAIGGEVDVLKAIQLLPGVQSGSEGSAGMYVRGGGLDENLIMLDGVPLYNVSHAMGMFSVFNADAIKTSAGALHVLPVCKEKSIHEAIRFLQSSGVKVFAATEKASDLYTAVDYDGPVALVMGAEDTGVSLENLRICDQMVKIPQFGTIGSLNVSVASSILIYEVVRQRNQA